MDQEGLEDSVVPGGIMTDRYLARYTQRKTLVEQILTLKDLPPWFDTFNKVARGMGYCPVCLTYCEEEWCGSCYDEMMQES